MTIVEFLAYRRYESTRAEANNAMMGLLAGAQLGFGPAGSQPEASTVARRSGCKSRLPLGP
jgi:hypothetical protein